MKIPDPHDAELVWRSPMMQPRLGNVRCPLCGDSWWEAIADGVIVGRDHICQHDAREANRQRYRSGYDIETGRIWPAA